MNELEALLALTQIPLLGSVKIRLLIHHFGSAVEAFKADSSALLELPGFGSKVLQAWEMGRKQTLWKENIDLADRYGTEIIPYTHPQYPKPLLDLFDYPVILYIKGKWQPKDQRSLAVVGTRQATLYGLDMARKISRELAQAGYTVVSGLARGIDTAAHQGALEPGRTIAVIGSGIAQIYPRENEPLAKKIVEKGALISEFPMNTPPDRTNFPQRNRLVSGLTLGTVLIEAPKESGAMLTMGRALSQGKKTFALPGRADQVNFQGNHDLIKRKQAYLVENGTDILGHFDHLFAVSQPVAVPPAVPLDREEELILKHLAAEELSIEDLVGRTKLPVAKLNVLLISLILKKVIKEYPGKIYKKLS